MPNTTDNATAASTSNNNNTIIIKTIINGDTTKSHNWQLKRTDPFSKILQIFEEKNGCFEIKKIVWPLRNNKEIFFHDTPMIQNMYTDKIVTLNLILDENVNQNGGDATNNAKNGISLRIRMNGDDKQIQMYKIKHTDKFSKLLQLFLEKNDLPEHKATLEFDGMALDLNLTPQGEDLDGDEIIEVIVK